MIEKASQEWREFCDAFTIFATHVFRSVAVNVNSMKLRDETKQVAQTYFRVIRPSLQQFKLTEFLEPLSLAFETLLRLSEGNNSARSYKREIKFIRKIIPRVTSQLEVQGAMVNSGISSSETDQKILGTLDILVPSAAQSYRQALSDLADPKRLSFRGPAHELRESLREVLDHFAPDDEVKKAPGFKLEKDRDKPTMKQKVRFIFKARDQNKTESATPENAATTIDGLIADMTRSTYDRGSLSAHTERGKRDVLQVKRYVDVVFYDILEIY